MGRERGGGVSELDIPHRKRSIEAGQGWHCCRSSSAVCRTGADHCRAPDNDHLLNEKWLSMPFSS